MNKPLPGIHQRVHHLTERLIDIQQNCRDRELTLPGWQRDVNEAYAYNELYSALPLRLRQACSMAYAMTHEPVLVFPEETIHGMFHHKGIPFENSDYKKRKDVMGKSPQERQFEEIPELSDLMGTQLAPEDRTEILTGGAILGHVTWNWEQMLKLGAEGLLKQHRDALNATEDQTSKDFHRSVIISIQAMLDWNRQHIEALENLLKDETDPVTQERLRESISVMERVPAQPASTFREALQSYHFQWTCVMYESPNGGNSPGRMDYLLWPYLKDEFESGALSSQQVFEMIAEVFLKMDERVHRSDDHGNSVVIGGIAPDGTDAVSPLSYVMIDVMEQLNVTHPYFYTRVHSINPPEYLGRCVKYLLQGSNRGQVFNDDAIIEAIMLDGHIPFEDAARYVCGGCMEISTQGQSSDLIWSFVYNIPKTLELCITGGHDLITSKQRLPLNRGLADFESFEAFYTYFIDNVRTALLSKFRVLDIFSEHTAEHRPWNLMSSMIDDCLERGREMQDGGARYHDYGGTTIGLPNAADSLIAIKQAVFDHKICDAATLIDALKADFVGHEVLRARLMKLPKFGQANAQADELTNRLLKDVHEIYASYKNRFGGVVKIMQLTFDLAPRFGAALGASPAGSKAKEPVAHGMTPQSSAMSEGLTAAINSYTSLDNTLIAGGASTMWDMDPDWITEDLLNAVVKTFLEQGGQIFQGNLSLSADDLLKAQKKPEDYYHLIVRVGGFSARFVNLNKALQDEIITRRRHRAA